MMTPILLGQSDPANLYSQTRAAILGEPYS